MFYFFKQNHYLTVQELVEGVMYKDAIGITQSDISNLLQLIFIMQPSSRLFIIKWWLITEAACHLDLWA